MAIGNVPSLSYSFKTPQFHKEFENKKIQYVGGMFLDGRAFNMVEQVKGPLLNPLEMNNQNENSVVDKIINSNYRKRFVSLFGKKIFNSDKRAFKAISQILTAYESSSEFGLFNSKYDLFLKGKLELTAQEKLGLKIFEDKNKGNCASCHISRSDQSGNPPLFTEFDYDNIGVPRNTGNPYYLQDSTYNAEGIDYKDKGLGQILNDKYQNGKFKVPTLRNIVLTAPYMYNGAFDKLDEVIDFYNTRDINPKWQPAEINENMNKDEMGDLNLTEAEKTALLSFLHTLTDNYQTIKP